MHRIQQQSKALGNRQSSYIRLLLFLIYSLLSAWHIALVIKHTNPEKADAGQNSANEHRKFDDVESQYLYDTSRLRLAMDELSSWRLAASRIASELEEWKLAAMQCGLYRADSDVSTPSKWTSAQSSAACALLAEVATLKADNERLRALLRQAGDLIHQIDCDWNAGESPIVAQINAALSAKGDK